jgi:hemerythrin superfamily protein
MNTISVAGKLSPSITKMIRMDHSHVTLMAHKYTPDASPDKKLAIVTAVCRALDIHAQLEEELFYPALREAAGGNDVLDKAKPEHDEMRTLIAQLRDMEPTDARYDATFMELIRDVLHHVADEETVLLPQAEKLLSKDQLGELGVRMTARRLQLAAPHAGEMAISTVRTMPATTMLLAGGLLTGAYMLGRGLSQRRHH